MEKLGLDGSRGRRRLVEVLHAKVIAHVVMAHEDRAEHEYQNYRKRNREEHGGPLTVEARELHDEICADDARVHLPLLSPVGPWRSASPVS